MEANIAYYNKGGVKGYQLLITGTENPNKSLLESRVYATIGEAQVAQGLAALRFPTEESMTYPRCVEFEDILKGMLRLAFSEKVWGNKTEDVV
jgi:hypothetical protein